jgi:SAM-dependent methyltransferase
VRNECCFDEVEVKRSNIIHHNIEADYFERLHPEGSSAYERAKVLKSMAFIAENSGARDLCVDVGCGTGFVASFELPLYKTVVATDISRKMLEATRKKFGRSINLILCDAESLPLKAEVADLVSVSSVLHHLPRPFASMIAMLNVVKQHGYFFTTREPNLRRLRRFFDFFDNAVVGKIVQTFPVLRSECSAPMFRVEELDYDKVDVHYAAGLYIGQLTDLVNSKKFKVILAKSYHWVYPHSAVNWLERFLLRVNFFLEKVPFSDRFGRYVTVIARKQA